ncbi:helix-turn-helix domain-containing protein (plasmid) [Niallia taxi]|uniref:helix-turn-helix domain-containing protein n=1 Tax=Niallia taxi TaxID=2499688 RepID=UPI003F628D73
MAKYSGNFKLKIVQEYLKSALSYDRLAQKYSIPSSSPIKNWVSAYKAFGEKEGIEGLQQKAKGRPSMSKKPKTTANKQNKPVSREEQLERENEMLRLEVAYLKKLKAFRENPDAFLEKHKQPSPSNLKKNDSD